MSRVNTSGYPEKEYIVKFFMIEGHQLKKQKLNPNNLITFSDEDYGSVNSRHVDALVIKLDITDQDVMVMDIFGGHPLLSCI